ncbi:MAG: ABC transporter substrate-binding protein [Immundisolibacter sp.]|uniref:ABC transporter substrate-binding protein n=1 Tax=Immundisolibacter sp. TaxID=1934948 RepID=UPI003D0A5902
MSGRTPRRIVCLTEETCETLYRLGEQDRIVGISGFTVRPARARREKPKVAAFTSARIDKILALEPDLVLGFSDLQADIAAALIRAGLAVHVFNQRTVAGILAMIETVGALVGVPDKAAALVAELEAGMAAVAQAAARLPRRPRVYFEEWDEPLISGIGWVSELIALAGGEECFPELAGRAAARERVIADPAEVVRRAPDLVIGSWCGKRFRADSLAARPGWDAMPAVRRGQVFEIKSCDILQPGPAALTDGLGQLHARIAACAALPA